LSAVWLVLLGLLLAGSVLAWGPQLGRDGQPGRAMIVVLECIYTITDPPLKFLRRHIPPLRLGSVALDLSFLVLMITVLILISVVEVL